MLARVWFLQLGLPVISLRAAAKRYLCVFIGDLYSPCAFVLSHTLFTCHQPPQQGSKGKSNNGLVFSVIYVKRFCFRLAYSIFDVLQTTSPRCCTVNMSASETLPPAQAACPPWRTTCLCTMTTCSSHTSRVSSSMFTVVGRGSCV